MSHANNEPGFRPSPTRRVGAWIAACTGVSLGTALLASGIAGTDISGPGSDATRNASLSIGRSVAADLEAATAPPASRTRALAAHPAVISGLTRHSTAELEHLAAELLAESPQLDIVAIFDAEGSIRSIAGSSDAAAGDPLLDKDFREIPWVRRCLTDPAGEVRELQTRCGMSRALYGTEGFALAHAVAVRNAEGEVIGIVASRVLERRLAAIVDRAAASLPAGSVDLVSDTGDYFDESIATGNTLPPLPRDILASLVAPLATGSARESYLRGVVQTHTLVRIADPTTGGGCGVQAVVSIPNDTADAMAGPPGPTRSTVRLIGGSVLLGGTIFLAVLIRLMRERSMLRAELARHEQESKWNAEARTELAVLSSRIALANDKAGIGIWDLDLTEDELVWDATMYRVYDVEPIEFDPSFESWQSLVHPDDRRRATEEFERGVAEGDAFDSLFRIFASDGSIRHIRATARFERDEHGQVRRAVGANWDVTDLVTANARLAEAQTIAQIGSWEYDIATQRVEWSDALFEIFDRPLDLGPPALNETLDPYEPADRRILVDAITRAVEDGTPYSLTLCIRLPGGGRRHIAAEGRARRNPEGEVYSLHGTAMDVTAREEHRLELEKALHALEAARAQAEDASSAKSNFLANMSHEIRTPMTAILGFAELLANGQFDTNQEVRHNAVATIRDNATHLLTILNDILDLSKIEAGRMTVEHVAANPAELVASTVDLLRGRAESKGIELEILHATPLPETILSDPTRLRQVLINLLGNAVKFTETGGVTVRLSCDRDAEMLTIEVRDTGIGMDADQLAAVSSFEAFQQADDSMTRRFGGTGLGLRISSAFAEMLGGTLTVDSCPGEGTTFTATVRTGPLEATAWASSDRTGASAAKTISVDSPASGRTRRLDGARILIAEDGIDNQALISLILEEAGARTTVRGHGLAACETIEASPESFDLVVMDMQMPVLDGYEATRRLREAGIRQPILALTAHAMVGDRERCLEAGCNEFHTKPIDSDAFVDAIRRLLDSGSGLAEGGRTAA